METDLGLLAAKAHFVRTSGFRHQKMQRDARMTVSVKLRRGVAIQAQGRIRAEHVAAPAKRPFMLRFA